MLTGLIIIGVIITGIAISIIYSGYKAFSFLKMILEPRITLDYLKKQRSLTCGIIDKHYETAFNNFSRLLGEPQKYESCEEIIGRKKITNIYAEWVFLDKKKTVMLIKYSDTPKIGRVWVGDTNFTYRVKNWFRPFTEKTFNQ